MNKEDSIFEDIQKALEKLKTEVANLRAKADDTTGKIMPVEDLSGTFGPLGGINHYCQKTHYWQEEPTLAQKAEAMKAHIEELWSKAEALHQQNLLAIEKNKMVRQKLELFMDNIGMPRSFSSIKYSGRYNQKRERVSASAGWIDDMVRSIPVSDGFEDTRNNYRRHLQTVETELQKGRQEDEKKSKQQAEETKKLENEKTRAALVVKYGLSYSADIKAVLLEILNRDKYLRLAHYLHKNRCDWSGGYDYAETGLNGFVVETQIDKEIYDDIKGHIDNWDMDGRIFRDTWWNYNRLFGMAPEDLRKDYRIAVDASGDDQC